MLRLKCELAASAAGAKLYCVLAWRKVIRSEFAAPNGTAFLAVKPELYARIRSDEAEPRRERIKHQRQRRLLLKVVLPDARFVTHASRFDLPGACQHRDRHEIGRYLFTVNEELACRRRD